jgi:hypothetical protein
MIPAFMLTTLAILVDRTMLLLVLYSSKKGISIITVFAVTPRINYPSLKYWLISIVVLVFAF